MKKLLILSLLLSTLTMASLFVISDKKGNIIQQQTLAPTNNASLAQKASEYSFQALYNELHQAEFQARRAMLAKERAERIAQAQEAAKKSGTSYKLTATQKAQLLEDARYYKGGRYVWGGTTPQGFDCSGYVQYLYKKHNISLPRTALAQSQIGTDVDVNNLQKGDLLFFLTDSKRRIPVTHVGIYIGNGEFIHAASRKDGIIVSPITYGKYAKLLVKAKRIIQNFDEMHTASL